MCISRGEELITRIDRHIEPLPACMHVLQLEFDSLLVYLSLAQNSLGSSYLADDDLLYMPLHCTTVPKPEHLLRALFA